jgi:hypothetical protein
LLVRAEGEGQLHTVEGDTKPFGDLLAHPDRLGKGAVLGIDAKGKDEKFRQFATDVLSKAPQLSPESRAMVSADGKEDGLFVTLVRDEGLLWFNSKPVEQTLSDGTKLPAISIVSQPLPGR